MLALFRRLISLREDIPALKTGSYSTLEAGDDSVLAYLREDGDHRVLVAINFGSEPAALDLSEAAKEGELLCSTHLDRESGLDLARIQLRPHEGIVASPTSEA